MRVERYRKVKIILTGSNVRAQVKFSGIIRLKATENSSCLL